GGEAQRRDRARRERVDRTRLRRRGRGQHAAQARDHLAEDGYSQNGEGVPRPLPASGGRYRSGQDRTGREDHGEFGGILRGAAVDPPERARLRVHAGARTMGTRSRRAAGGGSYDAASGGERERAPERGGRPGSARADREGA